MMRKGKVEPLEQADRAGLLLLKDPERQIKSDLLLWARLRILGWSRHCLIDIRTCLIEHRRRGVENAKTPAKGEWAVWPGKT